MKYLIKKLKDAAIARSKLGRTLLIYSILWNVCRILSTVLLIYLMFNNSLNISLGTIIIILMEAINVHVIKKDKSHE